MSGRKGCTREVSRTPKGCIPKVLQRSNHQSKPLLPLHTVLSSKDLLETLASQLCKRWLSPWSWRAGGASSCTAEIEASGRALLFGSIVGLRVYGLWLTGLSFKSLSMDSFKLSGLSLLGGAGNLASKQASERLHHCMGFLSIV